MHVIHIPKKVTRPKVNSEFEDEPSYPDVDEGFFLHESFGKTMFRPRNWDNSLCNDIIPYSAVNHKGVLDTLTIGTDVTNELHIKVMELVMLCWDVFDPDGIQKIILGCEFKIDTGSSKGVCYRSPSYGHYKGGIIMKHIKVLLNNGWITECKTGGYGAPNVLAPKPHQEKSIILMILYGVCV